MQNDEALVEYLKQVIGNELHSQFDKDGYLCYLDLSNLGLTELPIELFQLYHLQMLSLSGNRLTSLPPQIGQLSLLQELSLFENQLTSLPPQIGQLSLLQELTLHKNQLTSLPPQIGQLSQLEKLSLYENQLASLPPQIGQLSCLQKLYLNNNQLTSLPPELGQLSSLHELYLNRNQLASLPLQIGQLSQLEKLSLYENQLASLPPQIGQLSCLQKLYLNNNQLTSLPTELGQLSLLRELSLSGNPLIQLPSEIGPLPDLQELFIENCSLLTPPPEIVVQGTPAILSFLRDLQNQHIRRHEVKLIIVGEGGTGKSSLLRALHGKSFDAELSTTHGIELDTLSLPHPDSPSISINLNTWDFGGQHIYHATHQFFLTKRSLYLVVWNARLGADQGRLHYWLDTIKALAPDSPILLIATHTDERAPDLNYPLYKQAYPQLVGTVSVSNKYGTGIEDFKKILARQAAALPLVGQPWPTNWVAVEKTLMTRKEHHISADRYKRICAAKRVQAKLAQGTLGSYLHDLGKILYFRDDYVLMNLVVLKPNWVTKAISYVLEDEGVRNAHGILAHSELPRIWATDEEEKPYDAHLFPVFLRLMERFDLSYQIEPDIPGAHPTHSLVPQLLPHQPPTDLTTWPAQPAQGQTHLQMIYHFDFIPSGIMSWFIVRTHRYTVDKHWREGVLLAYQQQYARVEMNPMRRELRLLVRGSQPHNFFTILKDTLESILDRFVGLSIRREVPCVCHWQTHAPTPCTRGYRYEDLIHRMEAGKQTVECLESFAEVSVPTLLYGIHISTAPQVHAVIESSKQEIVRYLQILHANDQLILQRMQEISQLTEWSVRNFTRLWNMQMRWLRAECPNTFVLTSEKQMPFHPKSLISQKYRLHLLCQHPAGPHRVPDDPGYELRKPRSWWTKISPWLKYLITFLKYGFPVAGLAMAVWDHKDFKSFDNELDLLGKLHEELPEVLENDSLLDQDLSTEDERLCFALRVLYNFLKEVDPLEQWAGLHKIITPDGNILWLCHQHSQQYQAQPLQLSDRGS
jgi:internalin A